MKINKRISVLVIVLSLFVISAIAMAQQAGRPSGFPPAKLPGATQELGTGAPPGSAGPTSLEQLPPGSNVKSDVKAPLTDEEKVYLNVQEADIKDVIKQISKATARNFIIDDKIRGKVTIISERPMTREEAYQTFLSALEVAGYTTVKGPANVIKIIPLKDAAKSPIPTHVDSTPYTDSFVTRLIALDNISALEMSNAIKDLVSKAGNLFAYPATNTLIITDSGTNIDRIMKIVKELDQEGPQQVMEIIPIRNARASDVAAMVQNLFEQQKGKTTTRRRRGSTAPAEELAEVSKIIADERTNSIIVLASKRAIEKVRGIIAKLDSTLRAGEEGRIHVYYLKHAKAKDMAETLSSLTAAAGAKTKGKGTDIAVARFDGGIKITADESTNALIITALPKDFATLIERVISKLDIPRRQVYFEAVVMEMTLSKGSELGVSAFGGGGAGSAIGFGQTMGGPSLLGGILGAAATGGTSAWPAFLGGLTSSRTTDLTYVGADGTSSTLTVPAFSAFLSALATRGEANIVSTPNLLTLDNEEATMHVLSKEPTPGSTTFGASGVTTAQSVDYKEAGLELKIKPQITEGDMILLEIEQKLSGFSTPRFSTNLNAPAMKERKIKTTVVTENGQTVILAGLMDDATTKIKRKIPILGDIPILGFLFSTTTKTMAKSNMLIFITPHIIKDRTDFSAILKRKIEERNKFIDSNFSKSKRREIRNTIKIHREDLLEFRKPVDVDGEMGVSGSVINVPTQSALPQKIQVQPVVTVSQAPVESSAWKPVVPPTTSKTVTTRVTPTAPAPKVAPAATPSPPPTPAAPAAPTSPAPVITAPPEAKSTNGRTWKKPTKGNIGEIDLAY